MGKGIETGDDKEQFIPDEDFEYEKQLADEERRRREEAEARERELEEEKKRRAREAEHERERKIAQERLELMKMKQGIADESETIREEHSAPPPELHGKKKLENIWYHYKWTIIIGAFFAFVVIFLAVDTLTRTDPDLELLLICDNGLQADSCCVKLEERIARYTPDLNGDGEVKVSVISCAMNSEKYDQMHTINSQKFYANIQQGRIIMVVTDSRVTEEVGEIFTDKLPEQIPDNRYVDKTGLSLNFGFLAEELECPTMPNDVYIRMRFPQETLSDSEEKMQGCYDTSLAVLRDMANALRDEADACGDKGLPDPPADTEPESGLTVVY